MDARVRRRLVCGGAVQGVGFRPSVFRLARGMHLAGWVRNDPAGATIEVEGGEGAVEAFVAGLRDALPPLARLDALEVIAVDPLGEEIFSVAASALGERRGALVPPDAMVCADCRAEMDDPGDRRFHYPFTTCTNCGPRFSLVEGLPYDRVRTSMARFPLCPDCAREYADPGNRRFHAEPVCCPACGPRLWIGVGDGRRATGAAPPARPEEGEEALQLVKDALVRGEIVAVKGLGGFQLACRADSDVAVARLREHKRRPTKPFAVMARDLAAARRLVSLVEEDEAVLLSPRSPVLLAARREGAPLAAGIAPGLGDVGVLLPTTPLHVEIFREAPFAALVMTSGNLSEEPICRTNEEALERLSGIADLFLLHDRGVVRRVDDSVMRTTPRGPLVVRRARGFVPEPLPLPAPCEPPALAMGGHLQVTACLAAGAAAFCSQHVGDLDGEPARAFLSEVALGLEAFLDVEAEVIVVDLHPDYPSAWLGERLAGERGARLLPVQHHLAHAAATLAEHSAFPAAGKAAAALVFDGTGWGEPGISWGGELLLVHGDLRWRRIAHLTPIPLVGGERAVLEPWRVLAAALAREGCADLLPRLPVAALVPGESLAAAARLAGSPHWPLATGAGRVFEAAGALLGLTAVNTWEGEAAALVESLAASVAPSRPWPEVVLEATGEAPLVPGAALLAAAAHRLLAGEDRAVVAAGFHATLGRLAVDAVEKAVPEGVRTVALGGGCLVNRLLAEALVGGLEAAGFEPLLPHAVPPGDGGLSYGQAVIAALSLARGREPRFEGET